MKKLLFASLLISYSICVISLAHEFYIPELSPPYEGPPDDFASIYANNWLIRDKTTFGTLAKYSDVIGIGNVVTQDLLKLVIQVETALVGCTNGQTLIIQVGNHDDLERELEEYGYSKEFFATGLPTNDSRIVFNIYSNDYSNIFTPYINWKADKQIFEDTRVHPTYQLLYDKRSWWYANRENGLVLEHFTNIVQAVRIERNWTNYFYLCRDGAFMDSNRIKEDSFYDMMSLADFANTNQAHFINNDPMVTSEHKERLLREHPPAIMQLIHGE